MSDLSILDMARVTFLGHDGKGVFGMLACYTDDSGTHKGSRAIVWGGLVGHIEYFEKLDRAWRDVLANPCDGRPPIDYFRSYDLARGTGVFANYKRGERDLTRYNFRKAIVDSTVTALAFAVSVEDWNNIITGRARSFLGGPERWICGEVIQSGCDLAQTYHLPISFQFDFGRKTPGVEKMLEAIIDSAAIGDVTASVGFSPVKAVPALQAADMVAHQTYQHFVKTLDTPNAEPDAHMRRLMEDAYDWGVKSFSREGMSDMARYVDQVLIDDQRS